MRRFALALTGIALITAVGVFAYFSYNRTAPITEAPYVVPALTKNYTNKTYGFSLKTPESFEATTIAGEEGGETVILQDAHNNGIQIMVSSYEEDIHELTAAMINEAVPDMKISGVQVVEVGQSYKGVAFKSNNESFSGASREVWFVFRGNLYQISTYERLDDLLKQIFQTWQFQ